MVINHLYTVQSSTLNHHQQQTKIPYSIHSLWFDRIRCNNIDMNPVCSFLASIYSSLSSLYGWISIQAYGIKEEVQKDSFNPTMIGCHRNINNVVKRRKNTAYTHSLTSDIIVPFFGKVGMA